MQTRAVTLPKASSYPNSTTFDPQFLSDNLKKTQTANISPMT